MKEIQEQLKANQDAQFDQNMAIHTLLGNMSNWRTNSKNNANRIKMLAGRSKIFALLDRFKVK